ncbi:MAG: hypothetical protein LBH44_09470 [Treponema sp.]|jgi:hypothetical protein|nr:hypothetical protein [Treponema sp.]
MAKKKAVTTKKKPSSVWKTTTPAKKTTIAKKKAPAAKKRAANVPVNLANNGAHQQNIPLLPPSLMEDAMTSVKSSMEDFVDIANNNLTAAQRRRKIGPGVRNYGFIDKVSDLADANPQFAQFFKIADLKNCIRNIEMCRDLVILLHSFARAVTNTMLIYTDDAYSMALIYYNMVKEMSKRGDPTAMELYRDLKTYFKRVKHITAEPTEKELERDLHALIHGKSNQRFADGKIVVENISPKTTAGMRKVVDDVRKGRAAVRETESMSSEE